MDLSRSMVQILGPSGDVAGAGFLVTDDLVLTTTHAVRDPDPQDRPEVTFELTPPGAVADRASGRLALEAIDPPHLGSVVVAFPHGHGGIVSATVVQQSGHAHGLTLLRLRRIPRDSEPVQLAGAASRVGSAVHLVGFGRQHARAHGDGAIRIAAGTIGPGSTDGRHRIDDLSDVQSISDGTFVGGPLVDDATGAVIGVITEYEPALRQLGRPAAASVQAIGDLSRAFPQLAAPRAGLARQIHHRHVLAGAAVAAVLVIAVVAVAILRPAAGQHEADVSRRLVAKSHGLSPGDPATSLLVATALGYAPTPQAFRASRALLATPSAALLGHDGTVNSLSFSPDGHTLASAGTDGSTRLWDVAEHRQLGSPIVDEGPLQDVITAVAFSPSGSLLATSQFSGKVQIRNVATRLPVGAPLRSLASLNRSDDVLALAFTPDGRTLAIAGYQGIVRLWDVATRRSPGAPLTDSSYVAVQSIAFSPDGRLLASALSDGRVQLWNVATRKRLAVIPLGNVASALSVAFSPNGKLLATADADGDARLWELDPGPSLQPGRVLMAGQSNGSLGAVSFSPDSATLATGQEDGTVRLWDVGTGRQRGPTLDGGTGRVIAVAFSPDHVSLAAAGDSGLVRLWTFSDSPDYAQLGSDEDGRQRMISGLCAMAGRSISRQEWLSLLPDEPYRNVCPDPPN